eukprot:gb/GFBE01037583.1/.p1 GENE.gb/GFBE01037583.1/~~gb/GFBE01037583.1/.p1  ORF type:complete len:373 (+),score=66.51 gb/GFBE01037583.1/:1-1119(+)
MDFFWESVLCAPTVRGQVGACLLHASLWAFITDYQRGIMAFVERCIKRQPWYPTVQENYKDDPAQVVYKFPDPGFNFISFSCTVLHHGIGGLLMLAGMVTGQAWLWRHGMLTEVGGMDVLEAVKISHCKWLPPGTHPTSLFMTSPIFVPLMAFHHSVGMCVGIPVNLFFSEIFEFQLFGLVILGLPALSLIPTLFVKPLDGEKWPKLNMANQWWILITFTFGRIVYYFPAAWRCFRQVQLSPLSSWALVLPFAWALLALSVFNFMIVGLQANGMYAMMTAKPSPVNSESDQKPNGAQRKTRRHSAVCITPLALVADLHVRTQQNLTNIYVSARLLGKLGKARKNIKVKAGSDAITAAAEPLLRVEPEGASAA